MDDNVCRHACIYPPAGGKRYIFIFLYSRSMRSQQLSHSVRRLLMFIRMHIYSVENTHCMPHTVVAAAAAANDNDVPHTYTKPAN